MSRLVEKLKEHVIVNFDGKAELRKTARKSMRQIERYLNGEAIPPASIGYKLARQCGCTHEEALELARESSEAKRTA